MKLLDYAVLIIIFCGVSLGFKKGLVIRFLIAFGRISGAYLATIVAGEISSKEWNFSKVVLYLVVIFAGAQIGSWSMAKVGFGFRKHLLLGPLKFLDSALGAVLAFILVAFFAAIVLTIINYLPRGLSNYLIGKSRIFESVAGFNLLSFQIEDLLESVSSHLDQLKS